MVIGLTRYCEIYGRKVIGNVFLYKFGTNIIKFSQKIFENWRKNAQVMKNCLY